MQPARRPKVHPAAKLRETVQKLFREFGVLRQASTPCGQPLSPSHAHALTVLLEASRRSARPTQQTLAQTLGIDKSNAARLCARMVAGGELLQDRGAEDGRKRVLTLTAKGRRLAQRVEASSSDRFRQLVERLPASRVSEVLAALSLLNEAIASLEVDSSRPEDSP
jgi:MarR family transcriptional regulator for hemolysin